MSNTASNTDRGAYATLNADATGEAGQPQSGARVEVDAIVAAVAPVILEHEERIERDHTVPPDLADALYRSGALRTLLPREYGGLECHPVDYLDVVYRLSQLNGSVGWLAAVQPGASVLLPPEVMRKVASDQRWITAGSAGRVGMARVVDGGVRVNGRWPFASGTPHATFIHVLAMLVDDDGQPVLGVDTRAPQVVNVVLPRDQVIYHDTWDGLGLRGTGSGDLEIADVFVPDDFVQRGAWIDAAYGDRPLYRAPFAMHGHGPQALGVARAAIDAFVELSQRPPKPGSKRQSSMGREQVHQIGVAKADAIVRSARLLVWDSFERVWENVQSQAVPDYELRVQLLQAGIHGVRAARDAMQIVFELSGTDGVFQGRKMATCFRDLSTAAQHALYTEGNFRAIGQYYLTRDLPDGPQVDDPPPHFGPPPTRNGQG